MVEDAHPALVSRELFERVQSVVVDEEFRTASRSPRHSFPLTGLLRCSSCGGPMSGSLDTPRGTPRPNYKCSRRAVGCNHPLSISARVAEQYAMDVMDEVMEGERAQAIEAVATGTDLAILQEELLEAEAAVRELASLDARRTLGDQWVPMMGQLRNELAEVERRLDAARRRSGLPSLIRNWETLDEEGRWKALRGAVHHIAVLATAPGRRSVDRLVIAWDDGEAHAAVNRG